MQFPSQLNSRTLTNMHAILSVGADALVFILLAWALWRLLGRSIPIAVVPIILGLVLAATGWLPQSWGVPSVIGDRIGWVGVLLLAFTAGLETRQFARTDSLAGASTESRSSAVRFVASATLALLLPFLVGTLVAYHYFALLPNWTTPNGDRVLGSVAIGLCIAVSALPVLIGIVRELGPLHRSLTGVAVRIAVIDDAVLWIGLALLLLFVDGDVALSAGSLLQLLALTVPVVMMAMGAISRRRNFVPPGWAIWVAMPLYLIAGSWASSQLGLHALLGAYFAGAMIPPLWARRLPVERIGQFALLGLAPLFFGHSGLKIDGNALGWASLQASLTLLAVSIAAKLAAVLICPPASALSKREALAIGALLQCKGLMEIVAATILRDKGLLSEHAFAALVTLAVLSTLLTGPLFRFILGRQARQPQPERLLI